MTNPTPPFGPLVDGDWLASHFAEDNLRVIDFRWDLQAGSLRDQYLEGHIPGAAFVPLEAVTGSDGPGRHPLPSARAFQVAMRAAGISGDSRVVVYDAAGGFSAARLWWLLRHFGHAAAAVLDGGISAWRASLEQGEVAVRPGQFTAAEAGEDVVDSQSVAGRAAGQPLLDARLGERFRGEVEPVDARAGHVPGARSLPWNANLAPDRRFLPPSELRHLYEAAGVGPGSKPIVYCGSGVTACVDILAMAVAGIPDALLYEGSWSDWSAQRDLPIATGEEPDRG
ncbi:MAG: sulfurtransferase [Candidatus Dormibacteria bacterium]